MRWPFPIYRQHPTNEHLSEVFLKFAAAPDLKVSRLGEYEVQLRCSLGTLTCWSSNEYYAWAHRGSLFVPEQGVYPWRDEMPSRWAVRKMVRRIQQLKRAQAFKAVPL